MSTKDYIYLGLILVTALAFYCNGFYAGVCRSKRVYETLLDDTEPTGNQPDPEMPVDKVFTPVAKEFANDIAFRGQKSLIARTVSANDFGLN